MLDGGKRQGHRYGWRTHGRGQGRPRDSKHGTQARAQWRTKLEHWRTNGGSTSDNLAERQRTEEEGQCGPSYLVGLGWVADEKVRGQENKRTRGRPHPQGRRAAGPFDDVFGINTIIQGYASARPGGGQKGSRNRCPGSGSELESGLSKRAREEERGR